MTLKKVTIDSLRSPTGYIGCYHWVGGHSLGCGDGSRCHAEFINDLKQHMRVEVEELVDALTYNDSQKAAEVAQRLREVWGTSK